MLGLLKLIIFSGGPMFLMPGLICTLYVTKTPFPVGRREAMLIYLRNHQQLDGGWGTHIECARCMHLSD